MSVQLPFTTNSTEYYGIYRGKVLDNADPLKLGRIKVEIYPMFTGIDSSDLPWSVPAYSIFTGSGNGIGYFSVPAIGTFVFCMFESGNVYSPMYCFEAPNGVSGLPDSKNTNYPNRRVWHSTSGVEIIVDDTEKSIDLHTPSGHQLLLDDTLNISKLITNGGIQVKLDDADNKMSILHPSGALITIDSNGKMTAFSPNEMDLTAVDDINITCLNLNTNTTGTGSNGNANLTILGNVDLNVTGATTLTSGGITTIQGQLVTINP